MMVGNETTSKNPGKSVWNEIESGQHAKRIDGMHIMLLLPENMEEVPRWRVFINGGPPKQDLMPEHPPGMSLHDMILLVNVEYPCPDWLISMHAKAKEEERFDALCSGGKKR